jgi:hypothetical protein
MRTTFNIRYVGAKTAGETAFQPATGITWFPGDEHPIPAGIAQRMLLHPDVFQDMDNPVTPPQVAAADAAAARAAQANQPQGLAALLAGLPPGTTISKDAAGNIIIGGLQQAAAPGEQGAAEPALIRTGGTVGAESALGDANAVDPTSVNFGNPIASRFANLTEPEGFGGEDRVAETKVGAGPVDTANVTLAPGAAAQVIAPAGSEPKAAPSAAVDADATVTKPVKAAKAAGSK